MSEVVLAQRKVTEFFAVRWNGMNVAEVTEFTEGNFRFDTETDGLGVKVVNAEVYDHLHDTWIKVSIGDYIMRGPKREYYSNAGSNFDPDGTWEILERY